MVFRCGNFRKLKHVITPVQSVIGEYKQPRLTTRNIGQTNTEYTFGQVEILKVKMSLTLLNYMATALDYLRTDFSVIIAKMKNLPHVLICILKITSFLKNSH